MTVTALPTPTDTIREAHPRSRRNGPDDSETRQDWPLRRPAATLRALPGRPTSSALLAKLRAEWSDTVRRHDGLALEWGRQAPALEGSTGLVEVVQRCRAHDAALGAVLRRAQQGCPVAGRCVVQAALPGLAEASRRDRRAELDDYVAALWPVAMGVSTADLGPHPRRLVERLVDAVRRSLVRERRGGLWVLDAASPGIARCVQQSSGAAGGGLGQDEPGVLPIIRAAVQEGWLTAATGSVLASVYSEGLTGEQAAERHGTTPAAIRTRCSSAVRVLRTHRDQLLDLADPIIA